MATGVPANNQTIDFENLKWLVANGYLTWWGCGSGPAAGAYPNNLVQNWQDIEFYIGRGTDGGTDNLCPDWVTVNTWKLACQTITVTGTNETEGGRVPLSWNDILGESGYNVYVQNVDGGGGYVNVATKAANSTTHDYMGSEDTTYNVYIQAFRTRTRWLDGASETILGAASNILQFLTRLNGPSSVVADGQSGGAVQITFNQNSAVGTATHYEIYRRIGTSGAFSLVYTGGISATGAHSYTDSGLTAGTFYDYYVRVVKKDGSGNILNYSEPSNISGDYAGGGQQVAPSTMSGSVSAGSVSLSWDGFIGTGSAYHFRVEKMDLNLGTWAFYGNTTGNTGGDFLTSGECATYRVRMEVAADGSDPSSWVTNGSFLCG